MEVTNTDNQSALIRHIFGISDKGIQLVDPRRTSYIIGLDPYEEISKLNINKVYTIGTGSYKRQFKIVKEILEFNSYIVKELSSNVITNRWYLMKYDCEYLNIFYEDGLQIIPKYLLHEIN